MSRYVLPPDVEKDLREAIDWSRSLHNARSSADGRTHVEMQIKICAAEAELSIEPGEYPLSTPEGARAYVYRLWGGSHLPLTYSSPARWAVIDAMRLAEMKRRRARMTRDERRRADLFERKYGREAIFQAVLEEAAAKDRVFSEVLSPRTAYLFAVSEFVAEPPKDDGDLRRAEDRWRRRRSEKKSG